jgi:hypothetical protein
MRRRRMRGVSPTRSTIEGLTPAVNVGIAMSDYKGLTLTPKGPAGYGLTGLRLPASHLLIVLIALPNHESGLLRRSSSLDEVRREAARPHQADRAMRAARRRTARSIRHTVHLDRVTAAVDQGRRNHLSPLRGPLSRRTASRPHIV